MNCVSLVYSENIKIVFDVVTKDFYWYFMGILMTNNVKFSIHKKIFSNRKFDNIKKLRIKNGDKTLFWACERTNIVSIKIEGKIFRLDTINEEQVKLFIVLLEYLFGIKHMIHFRYSIV
jgi:hypothetical protein